MNKKSLVSSILNNIFSAIGFVTLGYIAYVVCVFGSLGLKNADTDAERVNLILKLVAVSLPALMCFVNLVMSIISYRFLGRGQERYRKGFMIAMIVVEIVALISFILYLVLNSSEILFLLISIGFMIVYTLCSSLHIFDFVKSKQSGKIDVIQE